MVNAGGQLTASTCTFSTLATVSLNSGSNDTLQFDTFSCQLAINSGAAFTINQNDFSNVPGSNNGIIASGNPSATINLTNNYWGTTVATQIAAKIKDQNNPSFNASLPIVLYGSPVSGEPAQTTASAASSTYNTGAQHVNLSATVTSPSGGVNQGTETFTVLSGSTTIGTAVTVNVASGVATASYALPAATAPGIYTIQAVYNGTANFSASTDTSHSLTVGSVGTTTAAGNASTTYTVGSQAVSLSATISSSGGTVNEGTETFTIQSGSTAIGSPVTVNVSGGAASASYTLPAATVAATYTIEAVYNGTANFVGSTDSSHSLTVGAASTATAAANASAPYSTASQAVSLSAAVTSSAGAVNVGTETFTILSGSTPVGNPVTVNVSSGAASASYTLPAGTAPATDTIEAVYSGTANLVGSTDTSHSLTINAAPQAAVAISLDGNSDSGAPDHPGFTNVNTPTFDVQVNQAGTITTDFDGNAAHDQTLTVSAAGTYTFAAPTLADGAYTATASFSAGMSGNAQNSVGYTIDTVAPYVTAFAPTGTVNTRVSQATVSFSEPVDLGTFTASAVTLTGPAGAISVNAPQLISGSTYSITFAAQTTQGNYNVVIAASVTDFAANPLGQSFDQSFTIALPDLAVTSTSAPSTAAAGASIPVGWQVANVSATNPTAATWNDAVYISTQSTLDNTAIRLTTLAGPTSPLAPGSNYSRSTSVVIPSTFAGGNAFLLFVANDNNGQAEADAANDTNDVVADAIAITAPDLQVTGVSGPTSGITGQTVQVTWTDKNTGSATATGPWVDNVYTATDAQGDNPTLLGSFTFDANLAAGASAQLIQQVILPPTAGTDWFMVTTNATQTVPEGSDTSVAANSVTIAAAPLPDLVVTSITPPANGVFSGTTVPLSFVVQNEGQAPTSVPVWQDWVILSQDATLGQTYQGQLNATGPGGDQTLNNQPIVLGFTNPSYLGVGDSYQQNVSVPLPINAQGTWYVYVVPDGTGAHHPFAMPEMSRTDKLAISAAFTITLSPPPELAVTAVQAPAENFSGQPMTASWTVTNNGTGPTATGAWTDALYMSTKSTLDASATLLGTFAHQGVLAVNGSYTDNETVTLPVGVSGSFYFLVKTDLNGQVFQNGDTGDNIAATSTAETVNLTPPPELEVAAISAPATALAGHDFTFSYTVTNAGAGATPNYTWNDALYLSPTATFNASTAIPLGPQTHQGSLAAGASYTNSVTVMLPPALAGSYYVVAITDTGNVVFEIDRTNNTGASTSPVTISVAPADLVVTAATAPAAAVPGSAIPLNWTVANQGAGDTAVTTWQDSVYVDTSSTLDSNAILLDSFTHYGLLAAGSSYNQSQLVTLPIDLLGSYNLFVVTNSAGNVYESNTTNNTSAAIPLTISLQVTDSQGNTQQAAVADLEVTSVNASTVTNGSVTVQWTVQNTGTGPTNATYWNDNVWMSTNTTLGSGGTNVYLGTVQHTNPLAAGASYSSSGTFTLPASFDAANYYFLVATDRPVLPPGDIGDLGSDLVYESNNTNQEAANTTTTPVSPVPLPDLTVANVSAPGTATSGGQLAVGWEVDNGGADTGNVAITDSVYLSLDQVFDPGTDKYLGSVTHQGGVAGGSSYTQNANLTLPSGLGGTYYVIVVTNSNNAVPEQDTTPISGSSATPVQIQLSPPADLVAGTVTIPASAVAGEDITLTYQVSNNGSNPANGSWYDALYLSPTPTWSISDPLLQQVPETQNLAPGGSYTQNVTAPLPGVAPGSYYVILRTNILDSFPEQNLSNNVSASLTQTAIDAPALTLGTPTNGTLNQSQAAYYKVVVGAGQTLQVTLTGQDATAGNELYVSYGTMPTRSQYDYRYSQPFEADQQITVPTTQAGAYYVLVYGNTVPTAPESYSIEAAIIPFSIQAVTPTQAGTGPVTLQISGAQFDFGTSFQLRNADGTTVDAARTLLQDSATAFATFDLTNAPLESYDVWAVQSDGTSTELPAGLSVVAATQQNSVQLGLIVPDVVLVGRPGTVTVTYSNPGNTDLPAPLMLLTSPDVAFQVPGQTGETSTSLQLFGINPTGPFGTLPPGFQGSITLSFAPITAGSGIVNHFTLSALADPSEPFDWNAVAVNDVPVDTSPQEWASMVAQAAPLMGSTWGSVVSFLDNDSVQLVKNSAASVDPSALNSLYNFDALLQYAIGIYGVTRPAATTPAFPVIGSQGEVTLYDGNVDGSGNPIPLNSSYPTFVIIPGWNGYGDDLGNLAQTIATDTNCFPSGHVNVVIATWQGASAGPTVDGIDVPWMAALHIDTAGTDLAALLNGLDQQGMIAPATTTVIGEGLGVYVGNEAAQLMGGLGSAIALNPASTFGGYLPPSLQTYFQQSIAYETSSLFDTQLSIAASNQTLSTGDINDPLLLSSFGVSWLTEQIQAGNCDVLAPANTTAPEVVVPANDPAPPSDPAGVVISSTQVVQIQSHDPNSIIGPVGSGTNNIVPVTQPLPYTIDFTNVPTAPAPAQEVVVSQTLSSNLDWGSFRLSSFGFGGQNYSVPANSAYYNTTLNLVQQFGFDVDVTATINELTGVATWTFTTIDPTTGQIPLNPTVGLLPANISNGIGEGFASYTIMAKQSDATGTVVAAQAAVTFDTQPPLSTGTIYNTLEADTGLTSSVTALPAYENSTGFTVAWSGTDASNGSGVGSYAVYVSDNGGPYTAWLQNTTLTSAPFAGQNGHSYRFYSVATSNAGNVQATPAAAQASTMVDTTPPTTTALSFPAAGASYDPGRWTGTIRGSASDSVSGVEGEQVSIRDTATGKYWNGSSFAASTETFVTATLANPGATTTTWSVLFAAGSFPADGGYTVHALATDAAGNKEATGLSASFTYDATPPLTTDSLAGTTGSNGWYRSAVTVTLSATDAVSGVAATYYTVDGGSQETYTGSAFTITGNGTHQITFWSVDGAGNTEATKTASFKIDSGKPSTTASVSGTLGSNGWYTSTSVSVTLSATDATSGVAATYYTIDGGSQQTYSGSAVAVSGDGNHAITFWSVDAAGNTESTEADAFKIDSAKPTTTDSPSGTLGSNGWYNSTSVSVTLSATDATSGVAATYYTIDGGSQKTYSGSAFTVTGDGTHNLTFWSVDAAGNTEAAKTDSFKIDTGKPTTTASLSGTLGTNGWYTSTSVSVTLSATDATSGVADTYYTIDSGGQQTYSGSALTVTGDGTHAITFWSVDAAGNTEATESDGFKIDSTKPTTTDSLAGTLGTNGWYTSPSVSVTLSATDATSGVAATYYTIDGGSQQTYSGSAFTVTGDGTHAITFWSVDVAGNTEADESDSFKIDSTKPTTTDSLSGTPGSNGWYLGSSVSVTLTATDATSGIVGTYYTVDGGSRQTYSGAFTVAGNGIHPITFWSVDAAGNTEAAETANVMIDNGQPTTTDNLDSSGWYTSPSVSVNLTATDAVSGVAATYYTVDGGSQQTYSGSAFAVSGEGTHHIVFWSVDVAGNTETPTSDSFKIDSVAPTTTDSLSGTLGSNGWFTSAAVSVTLNATDAISGVAATYYTIDGGSQQTYNGSAFSVSGDGAHHITFWSVDQAGNIETAESDTVKIDSIGPSTADSLAGTAGSNGWYTSATVSVTLSATDATSGVAATYYTVDGGSQQTYSDSAFAVTGDGTHHITFWSVDVAGNTEAAQADSFKIDSVAPSTTDSVSGTLGNDGWYTSTAVSVTLSATDAISGVAATYYTVDGGSQQIYNGSAFSVSGDGTHHIAFWSVSLAGNTETAASDNFKIDSTPPSTTDSLSGTLGSNGSYTSATVSITLSATDATSGVAATYYTVDGGSHQTYSGSAFVVTGDGTYHITFWSVDVAGNIEAAKADSFEISVTPSTTDSLSGTQGNGGWYTSAAVTVTLSATEATSGIAATYYTVDGGSQQSYSGSAFSVAGDGTHHITFWSVDVDGNTEAPESDTFKIDSTPPSTTDSLAGTLGSNGWYTSTAVSVTLSATDATSGVAATYYTVDGGIQQTYSSSAFSVSGDGTHHLTFWSVDAAGNTDTAESDSIRIDSVKPSTTVSLSGTQGNNGWYTSTSVSVTLNPRDATSGVAATYYTIDGGSPQAYAGSPFSVTGAGVHELTFWSVDVAGNTEAAETDSFTIAGPADYLAFSGPPVQVTAGGNFAVTVDADTSFGAIDPYFQGSVALSLTSGPSGGKLTSVTIVPVQNGVATFSNLAVNLAGSSYQLVAASTSDLLAATTTLSVVQAPQFKVTLTPSQAAAGQSFNVTIVAQLNNKPDTGYQGTVQLLSSDPQFVPQTLVFQPTDGEMIVPLTLRTPGRQTVTVMDASLASARGTSNAVSVTGSTLPLKIDHFTVTGIPSTDVSGVAHNVTITAVNAAGATVTNYSGTVTVTSSDGTFTPPSTVVFIKGVAHFMATLSSPGTQSLTVTDTNAKTGTEANIHVVSPATHLGITASPTTPVAAGSTVVITVRGLLSATAVDTQFTDALQLTTSDPHAAVTAQPMINGVQKFDIMYKTAGTWTIAVTDTTRPTIQGTAPSITVTGGAATQLSVTGLPLFAVAGTSERFTVTAEDQFGNRVVNGFTDTVQVAGQSYSFKPGDHGTHTFTAALPAGTQSLTATDHAEANVQSGTEAINVVSAAVGPAADPSDRAEQALVVVAPTGGTIVITPTNAAGTSVSVSINGKLVSTVPFTPTGHIIVYGQNGSLTVHENSAMIGGQLATVAIPAILLGGTGSNTLSVAGSSADNILVGGPGANTLTGGTGRDILIGGGGAATLHAGTGDDILIGGSTTYDANIAALVSLMTEWSRTDRSYQERIQDLFDDASGGSQSPYLLDAQTVFRGTAVNQLVGGTPGEDWFWFADSAKSADKISVVAAGDAATFE